MWADCATGGSVDRAKTRALHRENRSRGPSATRRFRAALGLRERAARRRPAPSTESCCAGSRPTQHTFAGRRKYATHRRQGRRRQGQGLRAAGGGRAVDRPQDGEAALAAAALLLSDFAVLMAVLSVVAYVAAGAPFSYIAGVLAVCVVAYAAVCAYCAFSANRRFVRLFSTMVKQGRGRQGRAARGRGRARGQARRLGRRRAQQLAPRRARRRAGGRADRRGRGGADDAAAIGRGDALVRRAARAAAAQRRRRHRPAPRRLAAVRRQGRGGGVPPRRAPALAPLGALGPRDAFLPPHGLRLAAVHPPDFELTSYRATPPHTHSPSPIVRRQVHQPLGLRRNLQRERALRADRRDAAARRRPPSSSPCRRRPRAAPATCSTRRRRARSPRTFGSRTSRGTSCSRRSASSSSPSPSRSSTGAATSRAGLRARRR